jgi:hypothetical protein
MHYLLDLNIHAKLNISEPFWHCYKWLKNVQHCINVQNEPLVNDELQ